MNTKPIPPEEIEKLKKEWQEEAKIEKESHKNSPPYLVTILLMVLLGFVAVVSILSLRKDLDFVIVSGGVFLLVTTMTTSIFNIMKTNQTLQEAHEANVKAQLALIQTKETHAVVNSKLDAWKNDFMDAQIERGKVSEAAAFLDGRKEGRDDANARTDILAEKRTGTAPDITPVQIVGTSETLPVEIVEK